MDVEGALDVTFPKRWSFAYRGYDGNSHQAREDANTVIAARQERLEGASEVSVSDDDSDADVQALEIVLRALPEMTGNGHPIDENPLTPPPAAVPMPKTKTEVVAEIFH